jgi:hypothetical protein
MTAMLQCTSADKLVSQRKNMTQAQIIENNSELFFAGIKWDGNNPLQLNLM